jgi:hypothetical protein
LDELSWLAAESGLTVSGWLGLLMCIFIATPIHRCIVGLLRLPATA